MDAVYSPEDYLPIYHALNASGCFYAVIGGQAANLWAIKYLNADKSLKGFAPFTSKDLDVYANGVEPGIDVSKRMGFHTAAGIVGQS